MEHKEEIRKAMQLLSFRDRTEKELRDRLRSDGFADEGIEAAVSYVSSFGYLDDRRYAENLARKYIEVKKYGAYRASREMYQKGLDRELVDEVLSAYEDGTRERICEIIRKKYSGCLDDRDKVRKMKNALVRQGYSFDDINAAVKMMDCECDDEY